MNRWVLLALLSLTPVLAHGENWANWRGPTASGVAEGKIYPTNWSPTENIAWKVKLPGRGASTPIVWGDQIFLTCGIASKNSLICYDRGGKESWRATFGQEKPGKSGKASGSNASAVTDGKSVFVYFKSGEFACTDMAGNILWQSNLQEKYGEDTLWWDQGTSPVLTKNHIIFAVLQSGPSYLAAVEKKTGKIAWKHDRKVDAPSESAQSYATPVVVNEGDKELLIVLGGDYVTAHDTADGTEVWRVGGLNPSRTPYFRSIASPSVIDGMVIAPYARGKTITCIKLGGSGDVTKSHVVWTKENLGPDVPTPAVFEGRVYVCTDKGEVTCLEAKTGKILFTGNTDLRARNPTFTSSPVVAGGLLYVTREDGKVFVLELRYPFRVIATNEIEKQKDPVVATPVFVDGHILIRTFSHLYCIGDKTKLSQR